MVKQSYCKSSLRWMHSGFPAFLLVLSVGVCLRAAESPTTGAACRTVTGIAEQSVDLTTETAHYRPLFGTGDPNCPKVTGMARIGHLTVDAGGGSRIVSHKDVEGTIFILAGRGTLHYGQEQVPVKQDDFVYLPVGIEHGVSNQSVEPLCLLVMDFKIPEKAKVSPTSTLMMANTADVPQQVLGSHGPTTQFKLLMGTTQSKRDKLPAARTINSLFLMDFAPGGTNIPHRHKREEEVYYVLRGHGDMVTGTDGTGKEVRRPSKQGDAFYFAPGTLVGFYSGTKDGEEHSQILAVRWPYPPEESSASRSNRDKR